LFFLAINCQLFFLAIGLLLCCLIIDDRNLNRAGSLGLAYGARCLPNDAAAVLAK
jgi:hypothetical protein